MVQHRRNVVTTAVLVIGEGPMAGVETARMRGNPEENRDGDPSATDGDPNANQGRPPDSDVRVHRSVHLRNEFHFSGVHGAMNRSGSRAK